MSLSKMTDWEKIRSEAKGVLYHLYGFVLDRKEWWAYRRRFLDDLADNGNLAQRIIASRPRNLVRWIDDIMARRIRGSEIYQADMASAETRHTSELDSLATSAVGVHEYMNDLAAAKEEERAAAVASADVVQDHLSEIIVEKEKQVTEVVANTAAVQERMDEKLAASNIENRELEKRLARADRKVEALDAHPMKRLGEHVTEESTCGVIEFDRSNIIVAANRHVCRYFGVELEDILGKDIVDVAHEDMTGRYIAVFAANAMQLLREGKSFEPNTFEIGGVPFDIMGYASNAGTRKFPVYGGGFIVLSPFKMQSTVKALLGKLWSTSTLHVKDIVSVENVIADYAKPLMGMSGKKPIYLDFKKLRSITPVAVSILAKCYGALKTRDVTCIFRNAPYDVAQMFLDRGVAPEHVRDVKMIEKAYLVPERSLG